MCFDHRRFKQQRCSKAPARTYRPSSCRRTTVLAVDTCWWCPRKIFSDAQVNDSNFFRTCRTCAFDLGGLHTKMMEGEHHHDGNPIGKFKDFELAGHSPVNLVGHFYTAQLFTGCHGSCHFRIKTRCPTIVHEYSYPGKYIYILNNHDISWPMSPKLSSMTLWSSWASCHTVCPSKWSFALRNG